MAIVVVIVALAATAMVAMSSGSSSTKASIDAESSSTRRDASDSSSSEDSSTTTSSSSSPATTAKPVIASSAVPGNSVDPAEAASVIRQLWAGLTKAVSEDDAQAMRVYEAGPAVEADTGYICQVGCPAPTFSTPLSMNVNVPHQASWPASFFATVTYASDCHTTYSPCVDQLVVQQDAADAPWRIVLRIQFGGQYLSEQPSLLPDAFALAPPDLTTANTAMLLQAYADYYTAAKTTGAPPPSTPFEDGAFTSDLPSRLYTPSQEEATLGYAHAVRYFVDPNDSMYVFSTSGGYTTCGTIRYDDTLTRTDGTPLDASDALSEFERRIPKGSYASIAITGVHMVCFEQLDTKQLTTVVATWGSTVSISGIPAR